MKLLFPAQQPPNTITHHVDFIESICCTVLIKSNRCALTQRLVQLLLLLLCVFSHVCVCACATKPAYMCVFVNVYAQFSGGSIGHEGICAFVT